MALLRSAPRYLLDTESYLYDEASPSFEDTFYSAPAPAPAPAPVVAAPAPAPAVNWTPWTDINNSKQIGDYYYSPNVQQGTASWEDPSGTGPTLTGLTRYKMSDWQKTQDPYNQQHWDPYAKNFIPYDIVDPATGQVVKEIRPEYTTGWQPGQAWQEDWKNPALIGNDLYVPGFETDWLGQQQLTGLTRFIGGKVAPGQTGQVEDYDPRTGTAIPGRGINSYSPYFVDPSGGNTFFEALMGALPMMLPIGAYAMGIGATGAGLGAADLGGAGIAEGMAPGVLAPASAAELAAVNSIAPSALDAGMGVYPEIPPSPSLTDLYEFAPPPDLTDVYPEIPPSPEYVRTSADRAAQYSEQGYGPGMSGAQTSAYDKVLELTGSKEIADLAARAVGGASGIEDLITNKVKEQIKQAIAPEKTQQQKAAKSGADLLSMLGIMGLLSNQRPQEAPVPLFQAGPALNLAELFGHTQTRRG